MTEGGAVVGIGNDLVDVERVKRAAERYGERFLAKLYTPVERSYCDSLRNPYPSLAARFAAKEAVSKAFGTGIGSEFAWLDSWVERQENGAPMLGLSARAQALLQARGATRALISLSHTDQLAQAFVVFSR